MMSLVSIHGEKENNTVLWRKTIYHQNFHTKRNRCEGKKIINDELSFDSWTENNRVEKNYLPSEAQLQYCVRFGDGRCFR